MPMQTWEETNNSFCNELQSYRGLDGVHSKKDKASYHDLTNCYAHPLSNAHHDV